MQPLAEAREYLEAMLERGVRFKLSDGRLLFHSAQEVSEDDRRALSAHKEHIIAILDGKVPPCAESSDAVPDAIEGSCPLEPTAVLQKRIADHPILTTLTPQSAELVIQAMDMFDAEIIHVRPAYDRQAVKALLLPVFQQDPGEGERLRDEWMERIAICEADGFSPQDAEKAAFLDLQNAVKWTANSPRIEVSSDTDKEPHHGKT